MISFFSPMLADKTDKTQPEDSYAASPIVTSNSLSFFKTLLDSFFCSIAVFYYTPSGGIPYLVPCSVIYSICLFTCKVFNLPSFQLVCACFCCCLSFSKNNPYHRIRFVTRQECLLMFSILLLPVYVQICSSS